MVRNKKRPLPIVGAAPAASKYIGGRKRRRGGGVGGGGGVSKSDSDSKSTSKSASKSAGQSASKSAGQSASATGSASKGARQKDPGNGKGEGSNHGGRSDKGGNLYNPTACCPRAALVGAEAAQAIPRCCAAEELERADSMRRLYLGFNDRLRSRSGGSLSGAAAAAAVGAFERWHFAWLLSASGISDGDGGGTSSAAARAVSDPLLPLPLPAPGSTSDQALALALNSALTPRRTQGGDEPSPSELEAAGEGAAALVGALRDEAAGLANELSQKLAALRRGVGGSRGGSNGRGEVRLEMPKFAGAAVGEVGGDDGSGDVGEVGGSSDGGDIGGGGGAEAVAVVSKHQRMRAGRDECVDVVYGTTRLRLNRPHFDKLRAFYQGRVDGAGAGGSDGGDSGGDGKLDRAESDGFSEALFCVLLRYKSIRGAGFQAAIPGPTFEALRASLGVQCELFASPLNAYFPRYCSVRCCALLASVAHHVPPSLPSSPFQPSLPPPPKSPTLTPLLPSSKPFHPPYSHILTLVAGVP